MKNQRENKEKGGGGGILGQTEWNSKNILSNKQINNIIEKICSVI